MQQCQNENVTLLEPLASSGEGPKFHNWISSVCPSYFACTDLRTPMFGYIGAGLSQYHPHLSQFLSCLPSAPEHFSHPNRPHCHQISSLDPGSIYLLHRGCHKCALHHVTPCAGSTLILLVLKCSGLGSQAASL